MVAAVSAENLLEKLSFTPELAMERTTNALYGECRRE